VNFLNAATNIRRRNWQSVSNIHVVVDQEVKGNEGTVSKDAVVNWPFVINGSQKKRKEKVKGGCSRLAECDR